MADYGVGLTQMAGKANENYVSSLLSTSPTEEDEYRIKMSAVSIYSGGADTVKLSFVL